MNFDGPSNSPLDSVIFACNDQGGRKVKSVSMSQPRPQALMRYRVTEGGVEPNAIAKS